jgi:hypothetical protein
MSPVDVFEAGVVVAIASLPAPLHATVALRVAGRYHYYPATQMAPTLMTYDGMVKSGSSSSRRS